MEIQGIQIRITEKPEKIQVSINHICGHSWTRPLRYVDYHIDSGETHMVDLYFPTSEMSLSEEAQLEREIELSVAWWSLKLCYNCYRAFTDAKESSYS